MKQLCLLFVFGLLNASVLAESLPQILRLPADPAYPNGITGGPDGRLYVGFVGKGVIHAIDFSGGSTELIFEDSSIPGTTALRWDERRGLLWAMVPPVGSLKFDIENGLTWRDRPEDMGISRLIGIDPVSHSIRTSLAFPKGSFINDLVVGADGSIFATDSRNPLIFKVDPDAGKITEFVRHPSLASEHVGLAGIAILPDGSLVVGIFADGRLLHVSGQDVREVELPRKLSNPDGLVAIDSTSVAVAEGATTGGEGRITQISLQEHGERISGTMQTLAGNLETPVNLTYWQGEIFGTDARVRHLFSPDDFPKPDFFRIIRASPRK